MPSEIVYKPIEKIKPIYAGGTLTPPKFTPTYYEWLFRNAEFIIKSETLTTNGTVSLYTVPLNKTFFLTGTFITATQSSIGSGIYIGFIDDAFNELVKVRLRLDGSTGNMVREFVFPIKLRANQQIYVKQAGNGSATMEITGFLVSNKSIPSF